MSDIVSGLCGVCGEDIYYDEGLQSWRHTRTRYDACALTFQRPVPRQYATPRRDEVDA